ncbi:la-related protein 6C [Impatiens glandulifera]|uniref:la-related protein 6C n=1 Tax=Impatiens glandulifera TaxID=253017 RepID=UPI001FB0CEED|nr:la-related protein 6C [Impatiens glandulifera]
MAQAHPEQKLQETQHQAENKESSSTSTATFKFNAHAPEFVPRSHSQVPLSGYYYPCFPFIGTSEPSDWIYVGDQEPIFSIPDSPTNYSKNVLTDELRHKIVKQVEYQLSDMSLLANESMLKHISKDPEGYVSIAVIASTKKIKSLTGSQHLLGQALQSSPNLIVTADNKKIRRKNQFTEKDREELQARTVVVENLPEDHSHPNLEKIFSVVGSVKNIRICHPQGSNSSRCKGDFVISNKIHALVEFESTEIAEKAVEKLNDERNWRKGLRVRLLLRRSPKSVLKNRKSEFDGIFDDDETSPHSPEESSHAQPSNSDSIHENIIAEESPTGSKKGISRGRGKSRTCPSSPIHNGRGLLTPPPPQLSNLSINTATTTTSHYEITSAKLTPTKGPRMPDGTRGFTMGRGKPPIPTASSSPILAASTMD